ncbi:MAG: cell division protein ZapA [Gammaproteobacteria bacterium]|nr:cell division protein ZapA [Gammaproteobacteria bacterium]
MSDTQTVTVSIMDKDYQVSCGPDEVAALRQSAQYLDEKMREIKSSSNVFGLDRLAVMAALNIANDLLSQTQKTTDVTTSQRSEIQLLNGKLDQALTRLKSAST